MASNKRLLTLMELGFCDDYSQIYASHGLEVTKASSRRKALAAIKKLKPDIIAAEFVYSPTYGSQLSNFESLIAANQQNPVQAGFLVFIDKHDVQHLEKLDFGQANYQVLVYPITHDQVEQALSTLMG